MEDFQFQRQGAAAALPGKMAAGGRAKPAARYDDVFGGPPRSSPVPARPVDYREIFGAAAACSIPVLDLPPPPEDVYELRQCSALDYLDIFGGFGGGDFAATYHELFPSQGSNGIGAPLPSELGNTTSVIGTSNSRESKGMCHEKQELPFSGNINEDLSRDQFGCSINGVALPLNDGTNPLNSPTHMASWGGKCEAVNMAIHKNQAQMIPGFSYIVKDPDIDKPHKEVDISFFFDSNSSKEKSEEPHLKKAELSGDLKYSVSAMKGDQGSTQVELSGSMIASTYKDNTSCTSKNQPAIPISNGFSAKTSNYQSPHENFVKKEAEGKCQSNTVTNCTNIGSESDLKVRFFASEDVCPNEELFSCSYEDHSASCSVKLSPDCSMDDFTSDAGYTRVAEGNHFKKSMPESPPCNISQSSEGKTTEQKMSNSIPDPQKDVTVNECLHSRSSSCQSISSLDRTCPDSTFLTVSDINLRTQPSQGPPPARPPPGRPPSKFDNSGRNLRRTLTDYQKHNVETVTTYKSHSFNQNVRDGSSPFDLEVDVSSAAAASVAAIKEAMELAQAKLKSAKVSRERKKDNLSRRKLVLNEDLRSTNRDEHQTVQDNQRVKEDIAVQLACGNTDGQDNVFAAPKQTTAFTPSLLTGDFKEKQTNTRSAEAEVSLQAKHWGEPEVSSVSNIKEDKAGEWKIAEQFYEFIQSEKKLSKVPENSLKGDTEKRSDTRVGMIEEERNATELKRRENLLEPSKFVVWEGDGDRWQNPCSQEPSLEFDMPWNCSLRQKETVNAHCQEKQPGEIEELLNTEQKTKWRTSEEGFICELSNKNLRVNKDALKYKAGYGYQGPEKVQNGAEETVWCEEAEKDINVTDDYFKDGEDNTVLGKLSKLDGNKTEANVMYVSNVSGKDVHLKAGCMNHEYSSFTESWEVEPREADPLFGQENGKTSKLPHQAYEWAKIENDLKVGLDIPDVKDKDGIAGAHEDFKGKVKENMQEVQVADSNEVLILLKSAQDGWKGSGNVKQIDDAQKARSLGEQQNISKVLLEFAVNEDAGSPIENDAHGHEATDVKGDKRENAEMSSLDKVREMRRIELEEKMLGEAKERERRMLKEEKEREKKLEEEKERERIRVGEEREREGKKLEEERKLKRFEEEKAKKKLAEERETLKLEEERKKRRLEEMEKKRLEEERERKRLEDEENENKRLEEEMEKKRLEEENERKRLEDVEREKKRLEEERERKKLEDKEREKRRLEEERKKKKLEDEEREKRMLEEERKKKKLDDEGREKKRLEEEKERKKLEDEQREKKKMEEEEQKKLEDEEREKKMLQVENEREKSEDRERKKSEEAKERRLEEEREGREREEKERIRKKLEEEDMERSKLEEKEREKKKQEEERERRRLEEIERERRKLEEKVRERKRIEEEERERRSEEEKVRERQKIEEEGGKEWRKREEEEEREREREKDRQAVERATREAHERAFVEARERAERAAVERITAEARQRALAEARERAEKASAEASEKSMAEKSSREARLRSERAAVERATTEARERAVEKAIAEKAAQDARERAEKLATTSREGMKPNFSNVRDCDPQFQNAGSSRSSYQKHPNCNASFTNEKSGGSVGESAVRCKAIMERHQRTIERAAKALAEKNLRDIIAQREQAERNRLAETLDADVKRWSNGKEGNLRALLSTLQYILGPESGWHPIPLTDVVTAPAVKKAYRKATLCVHPDKLQQRGASIHQKYICEKVFDLLKEAWNKFNSEER